MGDMLTALEARLAAIKQRLLEVNSEYKKCQEQSAEREKNDKIRSLVEDIMSNPSKLPLKRPRTYQTKKKMQAKRLKSINHSPVSPEAVHPKIIKTSYLTGEAGFSKTERFFEHKDAFSIVSYTFREILHRHRTLTANEVFEIIKKTQTCLEGKETEFFKALLPYILTDSYNDVLLSSQESLKDVLFFVYLASCKELANEVPLRNLVAGLIQAKKNKLVCRVYAVKKNFRLRSIEIFHVLAENRKVDKLLVRYINSCEGKQEKDLFVTLKTVFLYLNVESSYNFYKKFIHPMIKKPKCNNSNRKVVLRSLGFLLFQIERSENFKDSYTKLLKKLRKISRNDKFSPEEQEAAVCSLSMIGQNID